MAYVPENDGPHWAAGTVKNGDVIAEWQCVIPAARAYEDARDDLICTLIYAAENGEISHTAVAEDLCDLATMPPHGDEDWIGKSTGYGLIYHRTPASQCKDCVYHDIA